jgi:S1-C subfamily serine protease
LAIACTQLAAFLPHLVAAEGGFVHHTAMPKNLELEQRDDGVYVRNAGDSGLPAEAKLLSVAGRRVASREAAVGLFASLPFTPDATIDVRIAVSAAESTVAVHPARQMIPGRPYAGLSVTADEAGAVIVASIDDDSPAKAAGIHVGEIALRANDTELKRPLDWLIAMTRLEPGDRLLLVLRTTAGEERTLTLRLERR